MGQSYRGCPPIPACQGRISMFDLPLADLHTLCSWNIIIFPLPTATPFLFRTNHLPEPLLICQVSETVKPILPALLSHTYQVCPSPVVCKDVSCSLSYLLYASSLGATERKAQIRIGPLGQLSSQWKRSSCLPCWLPTAIHQASGGRITLLCCLLLTGFISLSQCCVFICVVVQATEVHGKLLAPSWPMHVKAGAFCLRVGIRHPSKEALRALNCKKREDRQGCSNKKIMNAFLFHIHSVISSWTKPGQILPP